MIDKELSLDDLLGEEGKPEETQEPEEIAEEEKPEEEAAAPAAPSSLTTGLSPEEEQWLNVFRDPAQRQMIYAAINTYLNSLANAQTQATPQQEEKEEEIDINQLYTNPQEVVKKIEEKTTKKVQEVVQEAVIPILRQQAIENLQKGLASRYQQLVAKAGKTIADEAYKQAAAVASNLDLGLFLDERNIDTLWKYAVGEALHRNPPKGSTSSEEVINPTSMPATAKSIDYDAALAEAEIMEGLGYDPKEIGKVIQSKYGVSYSALKKRK
jgi:hypothetical protein